MINPAEINLSSLPWLPLEETTAFPKRAAIYFALDSLGTIQYIGRSINVRARWGSHHKYNDLAAIAGIRIAYLFVDLPELLPEIETALIQYFNPQLNTQLRTGDSIELKKEIAAKAYALALKNFEAGKFVPECMLIKIIKQQSGYYRDN